MTIQVSTTIKTEATFTLDEAQLRALDAMTSYGFTAFKENFYKGLGESYLKPHEAGLKSLFQMISDNVPQALQKVYAAKEKLK